MPTQTFFNLPIDKQNKILKAAKKEFNNNILSRATVSNIVKEAQISRGSFYDYFEDLEDLFLHLISRIYKRSEYCFSKFYNESNNNYFQALKMHYRHLLEIYGTPENRQFNFNVIASIALLNVDKKTILRVFPYSSPDEDYIGEKFKNLSNKSDILELLEIVKWVSIYRFLSNENSLEKSVEIYSNYVDTISYSINQN